MPLRSSKNNLSFSYDHYTHEARLTTQSRQKKKQTNKREFSHHLLQNPNIQILYLPKLFLDRYL